MMSSSEKVLIIKQGRDKSLLRKHPWLFSSAVERIIGNPVSGETVRILTSDGKFLGWGAYSPESQIRARIWDWSDQNQIDTLFFEKRIRQALRLRNNLFPPGSVDCYRLVHGESDGLPGLIIDRYNQWLVVQFLSAGPEHWRREIVGILSRELEPVGIYERSDADVRTLEGLEARCGLMYGEAPPPLHKIQLYGASYWIDLYQGHKTGYYLDQRENHRIIKEFSTGRDVLDCFCYTGSFSIGALEAGAASVTAVDSSAEALSLTEKNIELNHLDASRFSSVQGDVFQVLRKMRDERKSFDLIVLDPPKFAPTVSQVQGASRGYKDINLLAFKLLRPGGILMTFSCSGGVDLNLFQKIISGAALDAGVDARIIQYLHQASDHPVGLSFPEGAYLKGLVIENRQPG